MISVRPAARRHWPMKKAARSATAVDIRNAKVWKRQKVENRRWWLSVEVRR